MPSKFIDFQEIKKSVVIEDAVPLLGLTLKPSGGQLRGAPEPVSAPTGLFLFTDRATLAAHDGDLLAVPWLKGAGKQVFSSLNPFPSPIHSRLDAAIMPSHV